MTPWFKIVNRKPRFEIVHVYASAELSHRAFRLQGGAWQQVADAKAAFVAVPLANEAAVFFQTISKTAIYPMTGEPRFIESCNFGAVSPSGRFIGCASSHGREGDERLVRKIDVGGQVIERYDVMLPPGLCNFADILFTAGGEDPVPLLQCERGYVAFVANRWVGIGREDATREPDDKVLYQYRLTRPRPSR